MTTTDPILEALAGCDRPPPPTRVLPNGDRLDVLPMTYGKGRLTFTYADTPCPELQYDGCWCYSTFDAAVAAQEAWNGTGDPPVGWHREPFTGRRRPDGDPAREYVAR